LQLKALDCLRSITNIVDNYIFVDHCCKNTLQVLKWLRDLFDQITLNPNTVDIIRIVEIDAILMSTGLLIDEWAFRFTTIVVYVEV